jgi:hypothetical protein
MTDKEIACKWAIEFLHKTGEFPNQKHWVKKKGAPLSYYKINKLFIPYDNLRKDCNYSNEITEQITDIEEKNIAKQWALTYKKNIGQFPKTSDWVVSKNKSPFSFSKLNKLFNSYNDFRKYCNEDKLRFNNKEIKQLLKNNTKNCSKCKLVIPLHNFGKDKTNWHGYRSECISCGLKIAKSYWDNNRDKKKQYDKEYNKNNPHIRAKNTAKRRSAKLQATPKWVDRIESIEIQDMYFQAQEMTRILGIQFHVDHIIPLQGKNVCGLHTISNLQVIEATENYKKHNHHCEEAD